MLHLICLFVMICCNRYSNGLLTTRGVPKIIPLNLLVFYVVRILK